MNQNYNRRQHQNVNLMNKNKTTPPPPPSQQFYNINNGFNATGYPNNNNTNWNASSARNLAQQPPINQGPNYGNVPSNPSKFTPPNITTPSSFQTQGTNRSNNGTNMFQSFTGNNMVANMAINQASSYFQEQSKQYIPGAYGMWDALKYYFTVNNSYVKKKIMILLFPFRHSDWERIHISGSSSNSSKNYAPPSRDLNAPDLYIPLMCFITYLLVAGFVKGTSGQFNPDIIGEVGTYGLIMQSFEIGIIKLAMYLFKINGFIGLLDLSAFTGYKYFSLVVNMTMRIIFGELAYYISLIYMGSAISYCTFCGLKGSLPESNYGDQKSKNYLLYGIAFFQFFSTWWNAYK